MFNAIWNRNIIVFTEAWSTYEKLVAALSLAMDCFDVDDPKAPSPLSDLSTKELSTLIQRQCPAFELNVLRLGQNEKYHEALQRMHELLEDDEVIEALFSDREKRHSPRAAAKAEDWNVRGSQDDRVHGNEERKEYVNKSATGHEGKEEEHMKESAVPSTWQLCFDPESCETYYYNASSGECQWHLPDSLYELEYDEAGQLDHKGESEIPEWYVYCRFLF